MASHEEVVHRWAQDDANGRTLKGFNLFYERKRAYTGIFAEGSDMNVIYSHGYHFPAAAFVTTPAGMRVVLVTSKTHSISTSRHLSYINRSIPPCYEVFHVQDVDPGRKPGGAEDFHRDNIAELERMAAQLVKLASKARVHATHHLDRAEGHLVQAARYSAAFGLPYSRPALDEVTARVQYKAEQRAALYRLERAAREAKEVERNAELRRRDEGDFIGWREGYSDRCPPSYRADADGNAYVRRVQKLKPDQTATIGDLVSDCVDMVRSDELQTSQGASVPWSHAIKVFRFVKLCRLRGQPWDRNGHTLRVGHFQVDHVDADGSFRAGCHRIAWAEIERLATREGVYTLGAHDETEVSK